MGWQGVSYNATDWAFKQPIEDSGAKLVLLAICHHADAKGEGDSKAHHHAQDFAAGGAGFATRGRAHKAERVAHVNALSGGHQKRGCPCAKSAGG